MKKEPYKSRLEIKVKEELRSYNLTQYEYLMANEYIDSSYKDNREGFLSYLENMFFKQHVDLKFSSWYNIFNNWNNIKVKAMKRRVSILCSNSELGKVWA